MKTQSISDRQLLWFTGFLTTKNNPSQVTTEVDTLKLCAFFMVTPNTVRRWCAKGLPPKIRHQLEMIYAGDALPNSWRTAGLRVTERGLTLPSGHTLSIDTLKFWPFLMKAMDWSKVPEIAKRDGSLLMLRR
jgi:hypothetical protein